MEKIFISIPSYEDELLLATIHDILDKASYPDRLTFGIALQYKQVPEPDLSFLSNKATIIKYDVDDRPGIIKIRGTIGTFIKDEKYFLGIDAHTLFRKGWDEILIRDHTFLQKATNNPLIAIGHIYDERRSNIKDDITEKTDYLNTNWKLGPREGHPTIPFVDTLASRTETLITNATRSTDIIYKEIQFVSQNFWFTTSDFWHNNYFPGYHNLCCEELEISMALYVNGYNMFKSINRHIVSVPFSETVNRNNLIHWKNDLEKNWTSDDRQMAEQVFCLLFLGENKYYSFKNRIRTVDDFWKVLGFEKEHLSIKNTLLLTLQQ